MYILSIESNGSTKRELFMAKISVKDLSIEEKLRLLCSDGFWYTYDCNGKLPRIAVSDGPVGLRAMRDEDTLPSIAYPSLQSLANTWNRDLAAIMGECLADDSYERKVDVLLGPGVNVKRHPLNGRNFEYLSEDPYLAGELAKNYVNSLQTQGIGACVKHFCCNNLEYNRFEQSSEVDERTLREIYYVPFEIACEAKPVSMMSAYNRVNGVYANENVKGFDALRKDFGFDGVMYSDWEAIRDRTAAAKAGCDIEFPFNQANYDALVKDYKDGKITEAEIDACADRIINFVYRCKEMQEGKAIKRTVEERLEVAEKIALEKFKYGEAATERRELIFRNWDRIRYLLKGQIFSYADTRRMLVEANVPVLPREIGLDKEQFYHGLFTAQLIRARYTLVDLLYEAGLLDEAAKTLDIMFEE